MNDTIGRVLDNEEIQEYLEYICIDGYMYYIYKEKFGIQNMELFFLDRYLGFEQREDDLVTHYSNGLENFLRNQGIMEHVTIAPEEFLYFYRNEVLPNNYQILIDTYFTYPDETAPFKYYSFILVNEVKEDKIVVTKIANIDPKVRIELTEEEFKDILDLHDGKISIYVYKCSSIFNQIQNVPGPERLRMTASLMGIDKESLEKVYTEKSQKDTIIHDILSEHQANLESYLQNGVERKKYSNFIRKISEAIKPSLVCLEQAESLGMDLGEDLKREKENVETALYKASNNILAFLFRKKEKLFDNYCEQMKNLDIHYKKYIEEYHKFIMKSI